MSTYPTDSTDDFFCVPSEMPYNSPTPTDPRGHSVSPDITFGTGDVRISASGDVETRYKSSTGGYGGGALDGGTA